MDRRRSFTLQRSRWPPWRWQLRVKRRPRCGLLRQLPPPRRRRYPLRRRCCRLFPRILPVAVRPYLRCRYLLLAPGTHFPLPLRTLKSWHRGAPPPPLPLAWRRGQAQCDQWGRWGRSVASPAAVRSSRCCLRRFQLYLRLHRRWHGMLGMLGAWRAPGARPTILRQQPVPPCSPLPCGTREACLECPQEGR